MMKFLIILLLLISCSKNEHKILFIKKNLSDIAYHKESQNFILLINKKKYFYLMNKYLKKNKKIKIKNADNYDFEGVTIINSNHEKITMALSNEKGSVYIGDFILGHKKIDLNTFNKIKYPVYTKNKGVEGLAFSKDILYLCREKDPIEILRYDIVKNKYLPKFKLNLKSLITDISSCTIHKDLIYVLSEESNKIIVADLSGNIKNIIKLKDNKQYEGITFINNKIILTSEPNIIEFL